jgi:hypothetical protein
VGPGGKDAALQGEGLGIELEDGEVGKDGAVGFGVEGLVVEDARGFSRFVRLAGDELTAREGKGLCGLVLDLGAELLLAAVGGGQVGLVEGKESAGKNGRKHEDRGDHAVEADAGGLHGGELGGAVE